MINYDGLFNKNYFGDELFENHFTEKKLRFKIFEDAVILPHKSVTGTSGFGGIVDCAGNFVEESFVHHGVKEIYTPSEEIFNSSGTVIYLGMLVDVWGHCLTDNLKRVWFLKSDAYKNFFSKLPIVYIPMWRGIIEPFAKILEILEIDKNKLLPITRPTKFKQIILPDESIYNPGGGALDFAQEYSETILQIKNFAQKNFTPLAQKKFYFFYGQNGFGEEDIAEYLRTKNYAIIRPEKLSFEEQLNILANCKNFASTLGSISHNSIFLNEGAETLFIPRWASLNQYQFALDTLQKLNVNYVDSTLSVFSNHFRGPYCYIVSEKLKNFFGDKWSGEYTEADFKNFLTYIRFATDLNIPMSFTMRDYYSLVLSNFFEQLQTRTDLTSKYNVRLWKQ